MKVFTVEYIKTHEGVEEDWDEYILQSIHSTEEKAKLAVEKELVKYPHFREDVNDHYLISEYEID